MVNKVVAPSTAERDAWLVTLNKVANNHGFTWVAFPVGEVSMYIMGHADDYAVGYQKMGAALQGCPEIMEALSEALSTLSFNVGSISAEWAKDIENWKEALPALVMPYETKQIANFDAVSKITITITYTL